MFRANCKRVDKLVCDIQREINGKYYQLMYGKKRIIKVRIFENRYVRISDILP